MSVLTVQTLRELAAGSLAELLPAAVQIGRRAGVILRQLDTTHVELYHAAQISPVAITALEFEPIADPAAQAAAMTEAVEALTICRRVAIEAHAEQRQAHAEQLAAIRRYAIGRMEQGVICQQGLDAFLAEFDLEPYSRRTKISYAITGSYEVGTSAEAALRDANDSLGPDLAMLYELDDQTICFHVDLRAEPL
ncbi:hypothetical protein VM98_03105 [Streptomyces rubellomurinus subsp. indigoferus]|nr:hypothetical protein VM98_03105 [Streptomyces rubellomurinus subsp. indigoferus]